MFRTSLLFRALFLLVIPLVACAGNQAVAPHAAADFPAWLEKFKQDARNQGISEPTLQDAFRDVKLDNRVITLDRKQPEGRKEFATYFAGAVTPARVKQARKLYKKHYALLKEIGDHYGVQPRFIVSLWGIETSFGANMGNFQVVNSLSTLAFDGRRSEFFRKELLQALQILDSHHLKSATLEGSWAGAMGQTQFMPSSYSKFAVDYDHSGFADIWHSQADVFASIANYLSKTGWDKNTNWGRKIRLPQGFDRKLSGMETTKPVSEWSALGVMMADGKKLPSLALPASVVILDESGREAYIVYNNYRILLDWNKSKYFATTVGLFADKIGQE